MKYKIELTLNEIRILRTYLAIDLSVFIGKKKNIQLI